MSDNRKDYGPAGCADGCASSGCGCGCLVALIAFGLALFGLRRKGKG